MKIKFPISLKRLLNSTGFNRVLHCALFRMKGSCSTQYRGVHLSVPSNTEYGRNPKICGLVELRPHFRSVDCQAINSLLKEHRFEIHELTREGAQLLEPEPNTTEGYAIWVSNSA